MTTSKREQAANLSDIIHTTGVTQHLAGVLRNDLLFPAKQLRDRELDNIDSMDWSENDDE